MSEQSVQEIVGLIDDYLDAYNSGDIGALSAVVANDDALVAYGTDEGETWHGWKEFSHMAEKFFHAVEEIRWERGKPVVRFSKDGTVAWFSEELCGHFSTPNDQHECPIRFTGIAERYGDKWKIVQFHRSVAVEGYSVPYLENHGVRFD